VAAIETLLALRVLVQVTAAAHLDVHLVAPNRQFVSQPLAVTAPFSSRTELQLLDLAEVASEQGARLHVDTLASVDTEARNVRLVSGAVLPYDTLVIAIGAQRRDWLEGALHFGGAVDVTAFRSLLERFESGSNQRLCFVKPAGVSWTLPLYELALLTASHFADEGVIGAELTVVTPETNPLAVFGPTASRMLRNLFADRGIALKAGVYAEKIQGGALHLSAGTKLAVDSVVTLAELVGPALPGLASDAQGFIPVDAHSRVAGHEDVYAAGDGTTFPIKHGGIATQQADAAAEAIAARMGAAVTPAPMRATVTGMLLDGITPTYLHAQIAGSEAATLQMATNPFWWPSKIAGRFLAPYLACHEPLAPR
jgi:sulfide:quinone oxidoreductase